MGNNSTLPTEHSSQQHSARIKFFPASIRKIREQGMDNLQNRFHPVKLFSVIDALEKETTRAVPAYLDALEKETTRAVPAYLDALDQEVTQKRPAYNSAARQEVFRQREEEGQTLRRGAVKRQQEVQNLGLPLPEGQIQEQPTESKETRHFGTLDFENADDEDQPAFKRETLPMMVLTGISKAQNQAQPVMQSEISGAASAAGMVGAGSIISVVLKYIAVFLIQYGFGPALYGLYTLTSSLVNLIASVFNLGLDDAMVRYTAIYRSKQRATSLQGLIIFCTTMAGLAGIIGAFLLLFFTPSLVSLWATLKHHDTSKVQNTISQTVPLLQIMAPMIPLLTMQMVWFGGLRGFKAFKWRVLTMSILQPLVQIVLLLFLLGFFRAKLGLQGVALIMFISTVFSTVLNLYFLFRQFAHIATPEREQYESREWLSFASFNFLTTIIDTVLDAIDTILLAAFGVANVMLGEYGAAIRISSFILMPLLTLNHIFAPTIAELHSKEERQKLEAMFKVVTKWSITFSLPIFLLTALFSPFLLAISGEGFIAAWPLVIAFGIGSLISASTGSVGYMLLMTGHQKLSFLNSIAAVVVNTVLGIILAPRYGAMGIAVSTGLAIVVINLMRLLQVRLLLKMHPYRWDMLKPLGAGVISTLFIGAIFYLLNLSHLSLFVHVGHAILSAQLLLIPVFLAIYVWLIILFKGSPEDEIVISRIRKRLGSGKN